MERAVEWFVAVTGTVVGLSHLLRPGDWAEAFRRLHRAGRAGAFVNGGLSLVPGAVMVAGHGSWAWPGAVLTAFGWLLVAKGAVCFLAPDQALWSMERGGRSSGIRRRRAAAPGDCRLGGLLPVAERRSIAPVGWISLPKRAASVFCRPGTP